MKKFLLQISQKWIEEDKLSYSIKTSTALTLIYVVILFPAIILINTIFNYAFKTYTKTHPSIQLFSLVLIALFISITIVNFIEFYLTYNYKKKKFEISKELESMFENHELDTNIRNKLREFYGDDNYRLFQNFTIFSGLIPVFYFLGSYNFLFDGGEIRSYLVSTLFSCLFLFYVVYFIYKNKNINE